MNDLPIVRRYSRLLQILGLCLLFSAITACGLVGGGDGGDEDSFPDPPGRPSNSLQMDQNLQIGSSLAGRHDGSVTESVGVWPAELQVPNAVIAQQ